MTVHAKSMLAAAVAALLSGPALAQDPASAPAAGRPKVDLPPISTRPTGVRLPGKVIWFDLLSSDPARVVPFYEGVLGWTISDLGGYAVARDGDVPVAGILRMPAPAEGAPAPQSRWMPLVSVADVAGAVAAVKRAGGRVLEGPGSLGRRGIYAAVADPRGAQFVLVTAAGGDPVDADAPPPGWIWAELWTDDPKGSAKFYRTVVGYETWQVGAGKQATWIYASGGRPRARAARMPFEKVPPQWLPYVVVASLKTALARVDEHGGRVLRKPGAKGPQFAVVSDPGGAAFILEQRPEQPAEEVAKAPAAAAGGAAAAPAPPPPPPDVPADAFGLDAAQQKAQQEAAAQAIPAQPGQVAPMQYEDLGAEMVVAAPAPYANVWIAPPAWGPYWGGAGWWAYPPGWIGAPWWGMPPVWGPGYAPPYYPGRGGYYPGYRPPPRPGGGPRPPAPGYRPPAPYPRGGVAPGTRSAPAPSSRPAAPPASRPAPAAPRPH
jgi:predicted enzyme related to lactoylglutathione lyase